jgi:uncharacterized membrane protein (UPF0127 family)
MNKIIVCVIALVFVAAACNQKATEPQAKLAGKVVKIEIADTAEEKAQGLAGRTSLSDEQGMLFVFSPPTKPSFWMKDMVIPIDIVWISQGKVVAVSENVQPQPGVADASLTRYSPQSEVEYVLELSSGWAKRYGLKPGDSVELTLE